MRGGRPKLRRGWRLLAISVGLLGGGAAVAYATGATSLIGPDGTINGCYKRGNGQLSVVAEGAACRHSELAVSWNREGPPGAQGPPGPAGDPGRQGPPGATNVIVRASATTTLPSNQVTPIAASCQPGERATGGGALQQGVRGVYLIASAPQPVASGATPIAWTVQYENTTSVDRVGAAFVACASP